MDTSPGKKSLPQFQSQNPLLCIASFPLTSYFIVTSILCLASYFFWDREVVMFMRHHQPKEVHTFFSYVTVLGEGGLWYGLAFLMLIAGWLGLRHGRAAKAASFAALKRAGAFFVLSMCSSGLVVVLAKGLIGRMRPRLLWREDLYGLYPFTFDYSIVSFPSGHTQTIFAAMTVFAVFFPRFRIPFFAFAILVGASRIFTNAHFVGDVLMGAFVGICCTILWKRYFEQHGQPIRLPLEFFRR
ncbi:phosphatase PAP2 family protein [Telmatospirillum sp. J64-1]|uniref:phosphatase PAP2 family protein n=1 Tax=Telmatospirillum sp. J64-1 TaxID=2502183 RepID=UPI00115D34E1|nr:phosphatase PAP2 family protein [Telmatospirillum sp. J64-1]